MVRETLRNGFCERTDVAACFSAVGESQFALNATLASVAPIPPAVITQKHGWRDDMMPIIPDHCAIAHLRLRILTGLAGCRMPA